MRLRSLFPLSTLLAACAPHAHGTAAVPAPRDSAAGVNYAIRQQYADSVEQAQFGAFFAEYRPRARPLQATGNYLGEMVLLRELAGKFPASKGVQSLTGQQIGTYASFLGDYAEALRLFDLADDDGPPPGADTLRLDGMHAVNAVDAIVAAADTAQVIFVNEAHHVPQHRALTLALLKGLRGKGFAYFAVETLSPDDTALNTRGYPVHSSGFYSNEPLFGEVLRTAHQLGYILVPYESEGATSQEGRESGEARNLRDRTIGLNPRARVLVHAGYSHINESGTLAGAKPMAVRFRELTGIDPVTIDQTLMREHANPAREHPLYRATVKRAGLEEPFVLRQRDGHIWSLRPHVHDITVFSPPTRLRDGRPDWLWRAGERNAYLPPSNACGTRDACVITARAVGESDDAVPVDAVLAKRGGARVPLLLPSGRYRVTMRDVAGTVLADATVLVGVERR